MTKPRLASGPQLFALNRAGRLRVVDEAEPVTATQAFMLVRQLKDYEQSVPFDSGRLSNGHAGLD
jgi:hypothetical protein